MLMDCYGFLAFQRGYRRVELEAYKIKTAGDATYICYGDEPLRAIRRIRTQGDETTVEWAFGPWEKAEKLEYRPISEQMEI